MEKVKQRTLEQNKRLHKFIELLKISDENKRALVIKFTLGRTEKSSEMYDHECERLISELRAMVYTNQTEQTMRADAMRKKIIFYFRKKGHVLNDGKVDLEAVNAWCVKYGYKHKALNDYAYSELPTLVTQAENMYFDFLNSIG